MRQVLRRVLEDQLDLAVIGEAVSAEDAMAQLGTLEPDLVLSDYVLPGVSGAVLVRRLSETRPELRCVVISADDSPVYQQAALASGALDFVPKDDLDKLLRVVGDALAP